MKPAIPAGAVLITTFRGWFMYLRPTTASPLWLDFKVMRKPTERGLGRWTVRGFRISWCLDEQRFARGWGNKKFKDREPGLFEEVREYCLEHYGLAYLWGLMTPEEAKAERKRLRLSAKAKKPVTFEDLL